VADFNHAVQLTLQHEGGFQKNPNDRANWTGGQIGVGTLVGTKYGITALDMPGVDIENITTAQAVAFYAERYWKILYSQINDQALAEKIFDMGVLFGVGEAVKIMQQVLGVTADEVFGPATLDAMNQDSAPMLLSEFQNAMITRAKAVAAANPADAADLPDWIRRIDS
jgi:lysozyme family protein